MTFEQPVPFREAVRQAVSRKVLPTNLSSADLAGLSRGILRSSMTSARTTLSGLLDNYKSGIASIVDPKQVTRLGQPLTVTEGFNPASLRGFIKDYLKSISYAPAAGEEGTIKDLSSDGRIDLVIKTNVETAQGAGKFIQGNLDEDVVDLWPAWELVRYEQRKVERDWSARWRIAAQVAGDAKAAACLELQGRMCALKSSDIWQALGDGEGGYTDTLGNPYPPFAFQSGMWCDDVSREEAEELGLLEKGEKAEAADFDFGSLLGSDQSDE
jgi:hypothetical protein